MLGLTPPMLKTHRVNGSLRYPLLSRRRRLWHWACAAAVISLIFWRGFTAGEWGDHIKWLFVADAKDNKLLPPPMPIKATLEGAGQRTNLVIAPVSDTSEHHQWLQDWESANWDLAAIYYGPNPANFSCPECVHIEANHGPKWQVVYQFTQGEAWRTRYSKQYERVYVPDDDIVQTTAVINTIFEVQERYSLDLSQPALCSTTESYTWTSQMYKELPTVLRYRTFVEVMVTQFSMPFFTEEVIPTLRYAESAYGLDWVWPLKLGFPQDRIAMIDQVCVIHPTKSTQKLAKASMYDTMTMHAQAEERSAFKRHHYTGHLLKHQYGMAMKENVRLGQVWQPWYAELLQQAGLHAVNIQRKQNMGPRKEVKLAPVGRHTSGGSPVAADPAAMLTFEANAIPAPWLSSSAQASRAIAHSARPGQRRHLVVSVINNPSQALRWMDGGAASWDMVLYINSSVPLECAQCLFTERFPAHEAASRFTLLHRLTQSAQWQEKVVAGGQYAFIYFPEDIIVQTTAMVNRLFELSEQHRLELAHPSLCTELDSTSLNIQFNMVNPHRVLRFTTWVDSLAPIFSGRLFHEHVVPSLEHAYTGFGVDWIWPWLARFEHDKIAIIDDICVMRPAAALGIDPGPLKGLDASVFQDAELPMALRGTKQGQDLQRAKLEEREQLRRFGYNPTSMGLGHKPREVVADIPQPWYQNLLELGHLKLVTVKHYEVLTARISNS